MKSLQENEENGKQSKTNREKLWIQWKSWMIFIELMKKIIISLTFLKVDYRTESNALHHTHTFLHISIKGNRNLSITWSRFYPSFADSSRWQWPPCILEDASSPITTSRSSNLLFELLSLQSSHNQPPLIHNLHILMFPIQRKYYSASVQKQMNKRRKYIFCACVCYIGLYRA